jgi:hypothetical protein
LTHSRTEDQAAPLTYTVPTYCRVSGLGPTTVWKAIREKRLRVSRPTGVRRTLIDGASGREFLATQPTRRKRGRPPPPEADA